VAECATESSAASTRDMLAPAACSGWRKPGSRTVRIGLPGVTRQPGCLGHRRAHGFPSTTGTPYADTRVHRRHRSSLETVWAGGRRWSGDDRATAGEQRAHGRSPPARTVETLKLSRVHRCMTGHVLASRTPPRRPPRGSGVRPTWRDTVRASVVTSVHLLWLNQPELLADQVYQDNLYRWHAGAWNKLFL
jgi:hypothetical protein